MFKKPEVNFPNLIPNTGKSSRSVILFGEVLADVFPERMVLGGAPFNVACHLRAFGINPILITRTGNDALRDALLTVMERFDMETLGVQCDPKYPTGQVLVHTENNGHRFEILPDQAYDFIHPAITRMVSLSVQPEMVYFGTLAQRNKTSRRALNALLESTQAPRLLDINLRKPWYDLFTLKRSLANADMAKVNEDELSILAGMLRLSAADARATAASLIKLYGLECLLVTRGAEGAWLLSKDGSEIGAEGTRSNVAVIDTVGAGDAFSSVFITGALCDWPMDLTLVRANEFASAVCGLRGAIPESPEFYAPFLDAWQPEHAVK